MADFSRYNLIRRIGHGGMAEVWKAKAKGPEGFEKTVAIKKILPELSASRDFISMFVEEAKVVADLAHPNVVQVFDFGEAAPGEYFIAMEYVGGQDLYTLLRHAEKRALPIPYEIALYVALECARGLAYAHGKTDATGARRGIVHRDLSPQNVLLSYAGDVKITDFGIAKVADAVERTQTGIVRGNAAYLSPEQAHAQSVDHRSDIFTLGAVFFELLTGRRLFVGHNPLDLVAQAANFRFPAEAVVSLPMEVQAILQSTLRSDPSRRYQDAAEMEEALSDVLDARSRGEARRGLVSLMATLFEEERRAELALEPGDPGIPPPAAPRSGTVPAAEPRSEAVRGPFTQVLDIAAAQAPPASLSPAPPASLPPQSGAKPAPSSGAKPSQSSIAKPTQSSDSKPARSRGALIAGGALAFAVGIGAMVTRLPMFDSPVPTPARTPGASGTSLAAGSPAGVIASSSPIAVPSGRLAAKRARLTVNAAPWCRVLIDGRKVADETPLEEYALAPGKHLLRFENPQFKFKKDEVVDLKPAEDLDVFVDVAARSVKVRRR